jgi:hypothetical protein
MKYCPNLYHILICFIILVHHISSYKRIIPNLSKFHRFSNKLPLFSWNDYDPRPGDKDYVELNEQPVYKPGNYIPRVGLESSIFQFIEVKSFSLIEYQLIFQLFPNLRKLFNCMEWNNRDLPTYEKEWIRVASLNNSDTGLTDLVLCEEMSGEQKNFSHVLKLLESVRKEEGNWKFVNKKLEELDFYILKILKPLLSKSFSEKKVVSEAFLDLELLWDRGLSKLLQISGQQITLPDGNFIQQYSKYFSVEQSLRIKDFLIRLFLFSLSVGFSLRGIQSIYISYPTSSWLYSKKFMLIFILFFLPFF